MKRMEARERLYWLLTEYEWNDQTAVAIRTVLMSEMKADTFKEIEDRFTVRQCEVCGKPLPSSYRVDSKVCSTGCRSKKYRENKDE